MKYLLTTDWHLGHKKIAEYCNRPAWFGDLLLTRTCAAVDELKKTGERVCLINLGDVFLGKDGEAEALWFMSSVGADENLLVKGNHDRKSIAWFLANGWDKVYPKGFKIPGIGNDGYLTYWLLTHRPHVFVANGNKVINIHGHQHNAPAPADPRHILLSPEHMDYRPIELEELLALGGSPKWDGERFVKL